MCVSTGPAVFSDTIVYVGRVTHPMCGRIEILGYQNTAVNQADGPNAMLLHLPTANLTPDQFIPVGRHGDLRTRMADVVAAEADPQAFAWMGRNDVVRVFEHDIYTVLLAENATLLPQALDQVQPRRRPRLSPELFEFYATTSRNGDLGVSYADLLAGRQDRLTPLPWLSTRRTVRRFPHASRKQPRRGDARVR